MWFTFSSIGNVVKNVKNVGNYETNESVSQKSVLKFIFKNYSFVFMCIGFEGMCVHHVYAWCPWRTEESIGSPGPGVRGGWAVTQEDELGIKPRSSKTSNAINFRAILQPHNPINLCFLFEFKFLLKTLADLLVWWQGTIQIQWLCFTKFEDIRFTQASGRAEHCKGR